MIYHPANDFSKQEWKYSIRAVLTVYLNIFNLAIGLPLQLMDYA